MVLLTAAHCVEPYHASDIGVIAPGPYGTGIAIQEIGLTPPADIAILRAADSGRWLSGVEPYREIQLEYELVLGAFGRTRIGEMVDDPEVAR